MPVLDLAEIAAELLVQVEAVLEAEGLEVPDRSFVAFDGASLDCCDQLTVHVQQVGDALIRSDLPGRMLTWQNHEIIIPLVVRLTRCYPTIGEDAQPPKVADINASALGLYADAWVMWNGLRNRMRSGELFADDGSCRAHQITGLTPLAAQGGCAGWQAVVQVALPGDKTLGIDAS